jgi:hypothetical protein
MVKLKNNITIKKRTQSKNKKRVNQKKRKTKKGSQKQTPIQKEISARQAKYYDLSHEIPDTYSYRGHNYLHFPDIHQYIMNIMDHHHLKNEFQIGDIIYHGGYSDDIYDYHPIIDKLFSIVLEEDKYDFNIDEMGMELPAMELPLKHNITLNEHQVYYNDMLNELKPSITKTALFGEWDRKLDNENTLFDKVYDDYNQAGLLMESNANPLLK